MDPTHKSCIQKIYLNEAYLLPSLLGPDKSFFSLHLLGYNLASRYLLIGSTSHVCWSKGATILAPTRGL